jgi:DNA-binding NarL/FixJ family response regulator
MPTRIVLAEPRRLLRDALADGLSAEPEIEVAARTDDAASTLLQAERTGAQVLLLSTAMGGSLAEICQGSRRYSPRPRTLYLDHVPDDDHLLHAVESGVDGYTTGAGGLEGVVEAIRVTARGESVVPPAMLGPLLRRLIQRRRDAAEAAERLSALTRREREVFGLLVGGQGQDAIARTLVISPETARTHVQRILRKLGVHSRAEAVALAARGGMADQLERALERSVS